MSTDTSNFSFQGIGTVSGSDILGCTDPTALNYDPLATIENGSCVAPILGCMDPFADNYNEDANTDDGTCDYSSNAIYGCTDVTACNYDPNANTDDGSCIMPDGCTDPLAGNYSATAVCDDGSCLYPGCIDNAACNFNPSATVDDGSCIYPDGCTDPAAVNYDPAALCDDGSCIGSVYGCTDPAADNYDANANVDDGTCTYTIPGCTDPNASNYNSNATVDDGSCDYLGCTDPTACNYDSFATIDDGTCILPDGCNDPLYLEYDPAVTCPDNVNDCNTLVVNGCMDCGTYWESLNTSPIQLYCNDTTYGAGDGSAATTLGSVNYNPLANTDDGSCIAIVYGCMDSVTPACNYDPAATVTDNSCTYPNTNEDCSGNCLAGFVDDGNGNCITAIPGCTDPLYLEYDASANDDNGTCLTLIVNGCTNPTAFNYVPAANVDDGSCVAVTNGCTDPTANNYSPSANTDDGSCTYPLQIGDTYMGGIIFYFNNGVDETGGGLVAMDSDDPYNINIHESTWSQPLPAGASGCSGAPYYNFGTGNQIGDGYNNTNLIYYDFATSTTTGSCLCGIGLSYHNGLATGYNGYNGYTDWFLPSELEMIELVNKIGPGQSGGTNSNGDSLINIANLNTGPTGPAAYWTSSENTYQLAYKVFAGPIGGSFAGTSQGSTWKYETLNLRYIRAFS